MNRVKSSVIGARTLAAQIAAEDLFQPQTYGGSYTCRILAGGCMETESLPLLHVDALTETNRGLRVSVPV